MSTVGQPPTGMVAGDWTGRAMVVTGLTGANNPIGGSDDPVADAWSSITLAPRDFFFHETVWTGRDLFVWGPWNTAPGRFVEGWRYDPDLDQWMAAPTSLQPSYRTYPSMVWTGREAIVWGGWGPTLVDLNTGARYFPQGTGARSATSGETGCSATAGSGSPTSGLLMGGVTLGLILLLVRKRRSGGAI
jgi:MYXO-CTERM domain-containing protein